MTGQIGMYNATGHNMACAASIWRETKANDRAAKVPCTFAIAHKLFFEKTWAKEDSLKADYIQYRDHIAELVGASVSQKGYWTSPPWNYGQLTLVSTLLRQPLEVNKEQQKVWARMLEQRLDPLGAYVSMIFPFTEGIEQVKQDAHVLYFGADAETPFYGLMGHGLGGVAVRLVKEGRYKLPYFRRLDLLKAMDDLAKAGGQTLGNLWGYGNKGTPGLLDKPREYYVDGGTYAPETPAAPPPKPKRKYVRKAKTKVVASINPIPHVEVY